VAKFLRLPVLRRLPGGLAADLDLFAEGFVQLVEHGALLAGEVGFFERVHAEVIEFERGEGTVLKNFPIATTKRIYGFAAVNDATLTPDEIEVARGFGGGLAEKHREKTDAVYVCGRANFEGIASGGEDVHGHDHAIGLAAGLDAARESSRAGDAQTAFVHVFLAATPGAVVRLVGKDAAIVRCENDESVGGEDNRMPRQ
jgi:hypothetical protein